MNVRELRQKYLEFFQQRGHLLYPSGSLVPYDVTGRLDESLLFNGAGMVQFKPYFRGVAQPENKRLTTAQKCVRTGDIEIVGDDTHLTFFEMLGNFSFGDYFKPEAIAFSWEFLTSKEWLNLDPNKLAFTIFEDDDEAYGEWSKWLTSAGIDPASRIFRLDEESNYWPAGSLSAGPPGPCGPNSEMFYWTAPEPPPVACSREEFLEHEGANRWVEIWNDVFISFEWLGRMRNPLKPAEGFIKEGMPDLPFKSIDTGMGLERTAVALGGFRSVYETDVFEPIFRAIHQLTGGPADTDAAKLAERVIADHIRTASFCISDGVFPSNGGRGYVLRRLIRRAVLKGQRVLGIDRIFFADVFEGVVEAMGDFYRELTERRETIIETLRNEETQFRRTLAAGSALLDEELLALQAGDTLAGSIAFRLYDTFGFPLEVTEEITAEQGIRVDERGYEQALLEAQHRSRAGQERQSAYGGLAVSDELAVPDAPATTEFLGYMETSATARIARIRPKGSGHYILALDRTPFYAESGGQVGDTGNLLVDNGPKIPVLSVSKSDGQFWHEIEWETSPDALLGAVVSATVDEKRRNRIRRNHTATHLLHAALRSTLGLHVAQAGSFVGPESLRFDFTHGKAMTPDEVATVEQIVNQQTLANTMVVTYVDIPIDEARSRGAMALFGEKYGDRVRMVEVGDFSRELCGGIHVVSTGEIGLFKILSEASAAGGIRRIEAVTGEGAYAWALEQTDRVHEAAGMLKCAPDDLGAAIGRLQESVREERKRREKAELQAMRGGSDAGRTELIGGIPLWLKNYGDVDSKLAATQLDSLIAADAGAAGLVAVTSGSKVSLMAKAGPGAIAKGAHAGNLVREVARLVGGSGGGRPDFASAGGKEPDKVEDALSQAPAIFERLIRA